MIDDITQGSAHIQIYKAGSGKDENFCADIFLGTLKVKQIYCGSLADARAEACNEIDRASHDLEALSQEMKKKQGEREKDEQKD